MKKNSPTWLPLLKLGATIDKGAFLEQPVMFQGMMMTGKNSISGG